MVYATDGVGPSKCHWNWNIILMTFPSLAAQNVVILTFFGAAGDENVVKMTFPFHWVDAFIVVQPVCISKYSFIDPYMYYSSHKSNTFKGIQVNVVYMVHWLHQRLHFKAKIWFIHIDIFIGIIWKIIVLQRQYLWYLNVKSTFRPFSL